jgi:hypothetical protein
MACCQFLGAVMAMWPNAPTHEEHIKPLGKPLGCAEAIPDMV